MSDAYLIIDDDYARPNGSTGLLGWQKPGEEHLFSAPRPVGPTIPRAEWPGLIKQGQGSFLSDFIKQQGIKSKDQNGLSLCWAYGSTRAVEIRRAIAGLPFKDLSPESVAGPCTGWRNQGGYASEAFNQFEKGGACESSFMDAPHSLRHGSWKAGWEENAKLHEAVTWYEIGTSFDEVATCLLNRIPIAAAVPRWLPHLVCFLDLVLLPNEGYGVLFQNSWGAGWPTAGANGLSILTEYKATPSGAACPVLVTQSNK